MCKSEKIEKQSDSQEDKTLKSFDAVISNQIDQANWNLAEQQNRAFDPHPSELDGLKTVESFGIEFDDGSVLTARKSERAASTSGLEVSSSEVGEYAKKLGEGQRKRWANEGPDKQIRKCNLFADCVFRDLKIPLPWGENQIPLVRNMYSKLVKATDDWELVSSGEKGFSSYVPHPGDLVIWDKSKSFTANGVRKTERLHHCGVMGNSGLIHYAGSRVEGGYTDSSFNLMAQSETYGKPTFIFRSKHVH